MSPETTVQQMERAGSVSDRRPVSLSLCKKQLLWFHNPVVDSDIVDQAGEVGVWC